MRGGMGGCVLDILVRRSLAASLLLLAWLPALIS